MGGTHRQFDRSMQRNPNLVFAREKEVDRNILKRMAGGGAKTMNANLEERFAKKKKKNHPDTMGLLGQHNFEK